MDTREYEKYLTAQVAEPQIEASELPGPDRTLTYGTDRAFGRHVYLLDGRIHVITTDWSRILTWDEGPSLPAITLRPDDRAYVEHTDFWFATLMAARDMSLSFTRPGDRTFDPFTSQRHDNFTSPIPLLDH